MRLVPTTRERLIMAQAREPSKFKSHKEEPMLPNANQELTSDQAKALLGPPPIMQGEREEEYWKWWAAFVEPEKPKRFYAWVEVNELAHKEWEQKRLRRCRPALVKRALISALSSILLSVGDGGVRSKTAKDYFDNDATEQRNARKIVASYGISEEQIVAEAIINRGDGMLILDRMESNRSNASRRLRKDFERREVLNSKVPIASDQPRNADD